MLYLLYLPCRGGTVVSPSASPSPLSLTLSLSLSLWVVRVCFSLISLSPRYHIDSEMDLLLTHPGFVCVIDSLDFPSASECFWTCEPVACRVSWVCLYINSPSPHLLNDKSCSISFLIGGQEPQVFLIWSLFVPITIGWWREHCWNR